MLNPVFNLQPSRIFIACIALLLFFNIIIVLWLPIHLLLKFLWLVFFTVYAGRQIWQHGLLRSQQAILTLAPQASGSWYLASSTGIVSGAILQGDSTLTALVCVLRFRLAEQRRVLTCVLFRDCLSGEDYRRLRVLAKTS